MRRRGGREGGKVGKEEAMGRFKACIYIKQIIQEESKY
jgi:hypothetical protein